MEKRDQLNKHYPPEGILCPIVPIMLYSPVLTFVIFEVRKEMLSISAAILFL